MCNFSGYVVTLPNAGSQLYLSRPVADSDEVRRSWTPVEAGACWKSQFMVLKNEKHCKFWPDVWRLQSFQHQGFVPNAQPWAPLPLDKSPEPHYRILSPSPRALFGANFCIDPGLDENVENVTTETAKISNSSNKRKLRPTQ